MKICVGKEKAERFYAFTKLNWELVSAPNLVLQNYKTEFQSSPVPSDPQWSTVAATEEEGGGMLLQ